MTRRHLYLLAVLLTLPFLLSCSGEPGAFTQDEATARQEECSQSLGMPVEITNSIGMKLRLIPAGEFLMGCSKEEIDQPLPWEEGSSQHSVRITKPFYLGVYEVTEAEYERVMQTKPIVITGFRDGSISGLGKDMEASLPVRWVSWKDAEEFCRKLSSLPEEKEVGRVYRLPTEAEWEYACRAGTTTRWSCGDEEDGLDTVAWYRANSDFQVHAVGEKEPNAWGLFDMHGNVSEWCRDSHGEYSSSREIDPLGPTEGSERVHRGGGSEDAAERCRSAYRVSHGGTPYTGFRVAADASGK